MQQKLPNMFSFAVLISFISCFLYFTNPILRVEPYILCHVFTPKFIYPGLTTRTLSALNNKSASFIFSNAPQHSCLMSALTPWFTMLSYCPFSAEMWFISHRNSEVVHFFCQAKKKKKKRQVHVLLSVSPQCTYIIFCTCSGEPGYKRSALRSRGLETQLSSQNLNRWASAVSSVRSKNTLYIIQ